jgi:steroid delta-isomerase-like uncharacterized protein
MGRSSERGVRHERRRVLADLIKIARESIEAFNAGDWERMKAALTADSIEEEVATGRRMRGPQEIMQTAQGWKSAFPDAKGTITNAVASGNTVTQEITWEGTQTGPLEGPGGAIPASGKRVKVRAVQVLTYEGEKIKENHHYFDMMTMLQQMGALPQPQPA